MREYIALIHKDAASDYGVSFPDLPGCVSAGASLDEARIMAQEALALHLEGLAADNEPLPEPSPLDIVMADRMNRDGVAIMIGVTPDAGQSVRVDITMPEDVLNRVDRYAAEHGMNRSGFLAYAAKKVMGAQ